METSFTLKGMWCVGFFTVNKRSEDQRNTNMASKINTDWTYKNRNKKAQSGKEIFLSGTKTMKERDRVKYFYKRENTVLL